MTVIVLAIEFGADELHTAARIAEELGFALVDLRKFELEMAEHCDLVGSQDRRPIDGWAAFSGRWRISSAQLAHRLAEEILDRASHGNIVITSWCAPALLSGLDHTIRVLLTAPQPDRDARIMRHRGYCDRRTACIDREYVDALVGRHARRVVNADWRDSAFFNASVVLQQGRHADVVNELRNWAKCDEFQETPGARASFESHIDAARRMH